MPTAEGPRLENWKQAVVDDRSLPPLQPGEQMTAGQTRHAELQESFRRGFDNWYRTTRSAMQQCYESQAAKPRGKGRGRGRARGRAGDSKKKQDYNDDGPASPWLILCTTDAAGQGISPTIRKQIETHIAELLGWDKITCKQLRGLLNTCDKEAALALLLRGSSRLQLQQPSEGADASVITSDDEEPLIFSRGGHSKKQADDTEDLGNQEGDELLEQHAWFELKTDIPMHPAVRTGVVPDTDERVALRGQKGIWATQDVPVGSILGPYRHYCMFHNTYNRLLKTPPPAFVRKPATWRANLEAYACNDEAGVPDDANNMGSSYTFVYSGWGYGNHTGYANDPHANPVGSLFAKDMPDEYLGQCVKDELGQELTGNCLCLVVKILDWPYMFMVTNEAVPNGREYVYAYGHGYWVFLAQVYKDVEKEAEAEELRQQLAKLQRLQAQSQQTSGLTSTKQGSSGSVAAPTTAESNAAGPAGEVTPPTRRKPTAAVSGVTSVGQGLHGLHLSSSMPPPPQQQPVQQGYPAVAQQLMEQQHETEGTGKSLVAASAVTGAVAPAPSLLQDSTVAASAAVEAPAPDLDDLEEEASSGFPCTLLAYRHQPLFDSVEKQQRLQAVVDKLKQQQLNMKFKSDGVEHTVQRIDNPEIAELIHVAEVKLSKELYRFVDGKQFKKLPRDWWDKRLAKYEYDQWEFIRRRGFYFERTNELCAATTVIRLTEEWRKELEPIAQRERWPAPRAPKRRFETVYKDTPEMLEELQNKRCKLNEAETEMQRLVGLLQELHLSLQQAGLLHQLAVGLQHDLRSAVQRHQQPQATARTQHTGLAAQAAVPTAAPACKFRGPIPGMGGSDSDSEDEGSMSSGPSSEPVGPSEDTSESVDRSAGSTHAARPAAPALGRGGGTQPPPQQQVPVCNRSAGDDSRDRERQASGRLQEQHKDSRQQPPQQQMPSRTTYSDRTGNDSRQPTLNGRQQQQPAHGSRGSGRQLPPQQQVPGRSTYNSGGAGDSRERERQPSSSGHPRDRLQKQHYDPRRLNIDGHQQHLHCTGNHDRQCSNWSGQQHHPRQQARYGVEANQHQELQNLGPDTYRQQQQQQQHQQNDWGRQYRPAGAAQHMSNEHQHGFSHGRQQPAFDSRPHQHASDSGWGPAQQQQSSTGSHHSRCGNLLWQSRTLRQRW